MLYAHEESHDFHVMQEELADTIARLVHAFDSPKKGQDLQFQKLIDSSIFCNFTNFFLFSYFKVFSLCRPSLPLCRGSGLVLIDSD